MLVPPELIRADAIDRRADAGRGAAAEPCAHWYAALVAALRRRRQPC